MNENTAGLSTKWLKHKVKEHDAALADIGSRLDDLSDTISSKQDALETSPDLTLTDGHILSLTDLAKAHLFCDLFNQAAGEHGHAEVVDGVFSCMLNGLELTYGEAVEIYMAGGPDSIACAGKYAMTHIRTHLPPRLYSGNNYTAAPKINGNFMFYRMDDLEVANLSGLGVESVYCMFQYCPKLREIIGVFSMLDTRGERSNMFYNCPELVEFRVMQMNKDIEPRTLPENIVSHIRVHGATPYGPHQRAAVHPHRPPRCLRQVHWRHHQRGGGRPDPGGAGRVGAAAG